MSSTGSLFSQTLQDITNTKLNEVALKREEFDVKTKAVLSNLSGQKDPIERVQTLIAGVKNCFNVSIFQDQFSMGSTGNSDLQKDLCDIDRFLVQASYDPCISSKTLGRWEHTLLRHIEVQSLKYSYSSLYGQLASEWLSSTQAEATEFGEEDAEMGGYEKIDNVKRMESRASWESSVFQPAKIDRDGINSLLNSLFDPDPRGSSKLSKGLKKLSDGVKVLEQELAKPGVFNRFTLAFTIRGLLGSDLLTDEKRATLKDFTSNETILREIGDVLNLRLAAIENWSWGSEVPLEQRRQLNGTFKIYMHEDLLQAIFLQFLGVKWSVFWKKSLSNFRKTKGVWKMSRDSVSLIEKKRREFFLGHKSERPNVESMKQRIYRRDYFMARLLDFEGQQRTEQEGEEEAEVIKEARHGRAKQSARVSVPVQSATNLRKRQVLDVEAECDDDDDAEGMGLFGEDKSDDSGFDSEFVDEDQDKEARSPMAAKQSLLHLLTTDIAIKCRLHGDITCFRSQMEDLYPSLSHDTIDCVLRFFGVSQKWLGFFRTFLQAPLRFIDDESAKPRLRMRGTPGAHVLSEVFAEVVLFCLDFKINQDAGGELLWRLQDDFWFWSTNNDTCVKAWDIIKSFNKTMGLTLNESKSGSARMVQKAKSNRKVAVDVKDPLPKGDIRWGMLYLDTGSGRFMIDQRMVDHHISELSRQLQSKTSSVLVFIQAWNTYATTFFTSNFGKIANCFGREHVDNMLATHKRIQQHIFSSSAEDADVGPDSRAGKSSIAEYLGKIISDRFGVTDIPDGFFFLPTSLGGLEVRNSFIDLLAVRSLVPEDPNELLNTFEDAEREAYTKAKISFEKGKTMRDEVIDSNFRPDDYKAFFSFEEYSKYREQLNYGYLNQLADVFKKLLQPPHAQPFIGGNSAVDRARVACSPFSSELRFQSPYWTWVAHLYGPEIIDRFNGLSVVDQHLLPMGMIELLQSGRIKWQD